MISCDLTSIKKTAVEKAISVFVQNAKSLKVDGNTVTARYGYTTSRGHRISKEAIYKMMTRKQAMLDAWAKEYYGTEEAYGFASLNILPDKIEASFKMPMLLEDAYKRKLAKGLNIPRIDFFNNDQALAEQEAKDLGLSDEERNDLGYGFQIVGQDPFLFTDSSSNERRIGTIKYIMGTLNKLYNVPIEFVEGNVPFKGKWSTDSLGNYVYQVSIENASIDTPLHEIIEPFIYAAAKADKQTIDILYQQVLSLPGSANLISSIKTAQPNLDELGVKVEVITQIIGEKSALKLNDALQKPGFASAFKNFIRAIRNMFGKMLDTIMLKDRSFLSIDQNTTLDELANLLVAGRLKLNKSPEARIKKALTDLNFIEEGENIKNKTFTYSEMRRLQHDLEKDLSFFGSTADRVAVIFKQVKGTDTFVISNMVNDPTGKYSKIAKKQLDIYEGNFIDEDVSNIDQEILDNPTFLDELTGPDLIYDLNADPIPGLNIEGEKNQLFNILMNFEELSIDDFIKRMSSLQGSYSTLDLISQLYNTNYNTDCMVRYKALANKSRFAEYDASTNTLHINSAFEGSLEYIEDVVDGLAHEIIHSKTVRPLYLFFKGRLDELTAEEIAFCKTANEIYNRAVLIGRDTFKDFDRMVDDEQDFYGFKNIYEFASEILTNKKFQDIINRIDERVKVLPGYFKRVRNLFNDFVNAVLKFLGIDSRIGDRESTQRLYNDFFSFQKTDPLDNSFKISSTEISPFGLDLKYNDPSYADKNFLGLLSENLNVQIQQFKELIRVSETSEEVEQRAYYERELKQRLQLKSELDTMRDANEFKNGIESFIRITKDRVQSIFDDLNTLPDTELASNATRNKIYILKSYLDSIGPLINLNTGVSINYGFSPSATDRLAAEQYNQQKDLQQRTLDAFDYSVWLATNPDPTTVDIVVEDLAKLAKDSSELMLNKVYPAIAEWLADDITDEDLQELDDVFKDEVDSILKSAYSDQKKLSLIRELRLRTIAADKALFLEELQNNMKVSTFAQGDGSRTYDTLMHPVINSNDLVTSLFAKKFKLRMAEARNRSNNVSNDLINAVKEYMKSLPAKGFGNIISPEVFFKKIVTVGNYKNGDRYKLLSEYDKQRFYADRDEAFSQYKDQYENALTLIDQDYYDSINQGVDPILAMVAKSNAEAQAKSQHNKRIRQWYDANTIAYTQQELIDIINNVRTKYNDDYNAFINTLKTSSPPSMHARIDEINQKFIDFRNDRAIDKINAEQQFSLWYNSQKSLPDFRSLVERIRNQFDYFEENYSNWYSESIVEKQTGDFAAKGKLIKLSDNYKNKNYSNLSNAERTLLEKLRESNKKWQNKLPESERLPEDVLPIVPKELGIAKPFTELPAESGVVNKITKAFKGLGSVLRITGRIFGDLFKNTFSDSEYRSAVNKLKGYRPNLKDSPSRQMFPTYYTNYKNSNIKLEDIESNPLVSIMKATIMANEYDAKTDMFSEIQLMDFIMENRTDISSTVMEDYIKDNNLAYTETVGDDVENIKVQIKNKKALGRRLLGGLIKFIWSTDNLKGISLNEATKSGVKELGLTKVLDGINMQYSDLVNKKPNQPIEESTSVSKGITKKFFTVDNKWEFFKDSQLYGNDRKQQKFIGGLGDSVLYYKSLVGLVGNLYSAFTTVGVGTFQNMINSATKNEFGKRNLAIGSTKALKGIAALSISHNVGINQTRLGAMTKYLFEKLDVLQGEDYRRMVESTSLENQFIKILNNPISKLGFGAQSYTEGFIALQTAFAVMEHYQVPSKYHTFGAKSVSFSKLYDYDKNTGHIVPSANFVGTTEDFFNLEQKIINITHKVMKENQGIYDSFNKIQLAQTILGRVMLQFRKYVIPSLDKRVQGVKLDVESMQYKRGYYSGTLNVLMRKGLLKGLSAFALNLFTTPTSYLKLSKLEKSSMNSFMMERFILKSLDLAISALLTFAVTAKGEVPDDDDDLGEKTNDGLALALFFMKRAKIEIEGITDPLSYLTMLTTMPASAQVTDMYKTFIELAFVSSKTLKYKYLDDNHLTFAESWDKALDADRYKKQTDKAKYEMVKKLVPITDGNGNIISYQEVELRQLPTKLEVYSKGLIPGYSNAWSIGHPIEKFNTLKRFDTKSVFETIYDGLGKEEPKKHGSGRGRKSEDSDNEPKEKSEKSSGE